MHENQICAMTCFFHMTSLLRITKIKFWKENSSFWFQVKHHHLRDHSLAFLIIEFPEILPFQQGKTTFDVWMYPASKTRLSLKIYFTNFPSSNDYGIDDEYLNAGFW